MTLSENMVVIDQIVRQQEEIESLRALCKQQHEALKFSSDFIPTAACKHGECDVCKSLAAYKEMK